MSIETPSYGCRLAHLRSLALRMILLTAAPYFTTASEVVFQTGFEAEEGYQELDLWGQQEWVGFGGGGNGIVVDFFTDPGQQAYIGFSPPGDDSLFLNLWRPLNIDPVALNQPLVLFSVDMMILDSTNEQYDDFRWSVYNSDQERLFTLDFDNLSLEINYALDDGGFVFPTEYLFDPDVLYTLNIFMNFGRNLWTATINDVVVVNTKPITTLGLKLDLGDIDAVWAIRTPEAPGDNFLVFDNYQVTLLDRSSIPVRMRAEGFLPDGRFVTRGFGEPNSSYLIEVSPDLLEWFPLRIIDTPADDGGFDVVDDQAASFASGFYRALQLEPEP